VHIGIEPHLAQDQFAALHACLARTAGAGVLERAAQAVAARVGEDQQAAHVEASARVSLATCACIMSFVRLLGTGQLMGDPFNYAFDSL
jgi:hypothetical protein